VACPFFMPVSRMDLNAWIHPPRLPLGDPFRGLCQAHAGDPSESQHELCNTGYARGRCDRFPSDSAADAVRFSVTGDQDGAVKLVYIVEKNHAPAEHGLLEYSIPESRLLNGHISETLAAQAGAFVESYLRRRVRP
jgi:hypothetical protein